MNEIVSALQSAIALNRQKIKSLHEDIEEWKERKFIDEGIFFKHYLDLIKEDSKKIAQLVRIQKMLKKQLAKEIRDENLVKLIRQFDTPLHFVGSYNE